MRGIFGGCRSEREKTARWAYDTAKSMMSVGPTGEPVPLTCSNLWRASGFAVIALDHAQQSVGMNSEFTEEVRNLRESIEKDLAKKSCQFVVVKSKNIGDYVTLQPGKKLAAKKKKKK